MTEVMAGVRVVEVALYAFVPSAGAVLADWGADVIKVEHSENGDPMRSTDAWSVPSDVDGVSFLWEMANRGKRGVAIDIDTPEGRDLILELARDADVFLTNFLPAARKRLGIDVDDIMGCNPRIVYARGSGQGQRGPEAEDGGFDGMSFWARGGISASVTEPGAPWPAPMPGPGFGDVQSGMALAGGIAAALFHRERTGSGVVVDVSLLAAAMWAMQPTILGAQLTGRDVLPFPYRETVANPLSIAYPTADGRFIKLSMLQSDRYWGGLCEALGCPELASDARLHDAAARQENSELCVRLLSDIFRSHTLDELRKRLGAQDGAWGVYQLPGELADDEQVRANGYLQQVEVGGRTIGLVPSPVQFDGAPAALRSAPGHGDDTENVLLELGHEWDALIELKLKNAIK